MVRTGEINALVVGLLLSVSCIDAVSNFTPICLLRLGWNYILITVCNYQSFFQDQIIMT